MKGVKQRVLGPEPGTGIKNCYFGDCAVVSISQAFEVDQISILIICDLLKIKDPLSGLSFFQCKKLINALTRGNTMIKYQSNKAKLTYTQLTHVLDECRLLVVFEAHLSYANKGVIYDPYLKNTFKDNRLAYLKACPTGWWKIRR